MEPEVELCNETASANQTNFDCVSMGLRAFHGLFLALMLAAAWAGNFTVLALVCKHRGLRQRSVLASLGLVVADILMATVWVFQGEASTIAGEWPFGDGGCSVFAYMYLTLLFVRWGEILVFTNDRFSQIFFPFWYRRWANVLLITSTILAWSVAAVATIPMVALRYTAYYLSLTACSVNCGEERSCANGVIGLFGLFIFIGGVVPTIMYIAAYLYGWKKKREMKRMLKMGTGEGIPNDASFNDGYWMSPQNTRALTTCFLVFITTVITNIPIYVTSSLRQREEVYQQIPTWTHFVVTYFFLLGPVLDPLVVMRTKNFRDVIRTSCCRCNGQVALNGTISNALRNILFQSLSSDETVKSSTDTNL